MAGSTLRMGIRPAFFVSIVKPFLLTAVLFAFIAGDASAQRRHGSSPLDTLGEEVSQAEGLEILNAFRRLGIAGDYRLSFTLEIRPRKEKTTTVSGLLLGTQSTYGPLSRIDIALEPADVTELGKLVPAKVKRLLLQNGIFANALEVNSWEGGEAGGARLIESAAFFEKIAGSDFTVFDLLMPFSFWQEFKYEGRTTMRSRPTHVFSLYPPSEDEELGKRISQVRIYLDEEFNALNRVEIFDASEELVKTISVVAFKIVDGQGVLSQVDVRNEETRDKTRFRVLDAAIGVEVPDWVFEPEGLGKNIYGTELAHLQAPESSDADVDQ
ncbi:outer membrane lipoprotein-sorting protein [Pelagicoccus sp. SDUM812002]|uniref:outer membrane lipoprotein-sorting protein n=1 Tax=Pelagicoccus sp. SDUM812002 TaxID=3041266 RepID=UPI00280D1B12|nr:outer membrane lipoprotein-sorting protein [Pelagicoccus sp. SDUM812002]MDQ8186732.1 outer membrane lipoprotein-sorting protein [Pelagicoccus sp. SDUM812002]